MRHGALLEDGTADYGIVGTSEVRKELRGEKTGVITHCTLEAEPCMSATWDPVYSSGRNRII